MIEVWFYAGYSERSLWFSVESEAEATAIALIELGADCVEILLHLRDRTILIDHFESEDW